MSDHAAPEIETPPLPRPPGTREFTFRAVIVSLLVAVMIAASYPYIVLKLGFGPNIAVVSAFFGYLMLAVVSRGVALRFESNLAQAAGTIAGQTAFMCTILAAFDLLSGDKALGLSISLGPWQIFMWLVTAGTLGVFLGVPMRRHYIVDEKLPYADGIAAAETLLVLDARGREAKVAIVSMLSGLASSAALSLITMREVFGLHEVVKLPLNLYSKITGVGFALSLLNIGSGMIIGLRICANMFAGMILSWIIAPLVLNSHGIIGPPDPDITKKNDILLWVMWPATGLMVAGGLTALVLKWRILARSFKGLASAGTDDEDLPGRWLVAGIVTSAISVVLVQYFALGLDVMHSLLALVFSLPLMLVGLRVLGETNWGPISALSNVMQGVFGAIAPGNVQANMVASGLTGTIVANSEGLIQSYKTGHMIGSKPRYLTYAQLLAVPVAAVVIALVYPIFKASQRIGEPDGFIPAISAKWYGFAKILSKDGAIPESAVWGLAIGAALGIVFTILEGNPRWKKWVPSPTGVGIGMLVPAAYVTTMFVGAWIAWFAQRKSGAKADGWVVPLASGFIAGEALIAVIMAVLLATGLVLPVL
ncbi:MAG: OPT family oligopeptide transporter [Planctomycetota bacterium]|nr:OPT family oligopeptide transporter [Planctomycetota bacterium]